MNYDNFNKKLNFDFPDFEEEGVIRYEELLTTLLNKSKIGGTCKYVDRAFKPNCFYYWAFKVIGMEYLWLFHF